MYVHVHRWRTSFIFQNLFLTYAPPILGRSDDEICAYNTNLATAYNHGHPRPKYTSVYILGLQICKANLLLRRTSGIRAASDTLNIFRSNADTPSRKPFEIDDADTRNTVKKYRRRIFDTLSSGRDAAGSNRSDISALPKFAIKSVHGCTLLMMRRRRCVVYFKRTD